MDLAGGRVGRRAAILLGVADLAELAKSGTVFTDAPPMTAEQLIMLGLLGHIDDHLGSIRKTVGMGHESP